jgi:hypothetical protein
MYSKKYHGNKVSQFPVEVRFWAKVKKGGENDCWEWMAGKDKDGYGRFRYGKQKARANKVAWEITNGPIPDGLWVLHTCDNPRCVNINHLYLGTVKENAIDRDSRGRGAKGEHVGTSKLLASDVIKIRRLCLEKSRKELSVEFNTSQTNIFNIINRKSWNWL